MRWAARGLGKIHCRIIRCLSHPPSTSRIVFSSIILISYPRKPNKPRTHDESLKVPLSIPHYSGTKANWKTSSQCSANSNSLAVVKSPCQSRSLAATSTELPGSAAATTHTTIQSRPRKASPRCNQNTQRRIKTDPAS